MATTAQLPLLATTLPAREQPSTVAHDFVGTLQALGVRQAFGVTGGAIAAVCDAIGRSELAFIHCRHEGGAAFAAAESFFASDRPAVVLTTTGPGLLNALTGVQAARSEGAKLILVSAGTPAPVRGRWACQETSPYTLPWSGLFTSGPLFDLAVAVEHPAELPQVVARLAQGLARPAGFVAHICLPPSIQALPVDRAAPLPRRRVAPVACERRTLASIARMLTTGSFVIWVGFGARHAAQQVRALARRTGAPVISSPRGKGIFPEDHPQYFGVTGLAGHPSVERLFADHRPERALVLGTRLGEPTSFWDERLVPPGGFVHVDLDPMVPGSAYPRASTLAVHADIATFLAQLLEELPSEDGPRPNLVCVDRGASAKSPPATGRPVGARFLFDAIQRLVVEGSEALVLAECGNAFAWANHLLLFRDPGRYRVSVGFGSMGHAAAGVVGAALGRGGKAVAIVGDGAMLMNNEISTAVQTEAQAVWVVMNDHGYGMVEQGMRAQGLRPVQTDIPQVDFAALARAVGADGATVDSEPQLEQALQAALAARGPFVVDVRTDPGEAGPWIKRIHSLIAQSAPGKQT
jgi:acetolactate synthase I/II/III large subunit